MRNAPSRPTLLLPAAAIEKVVENLNTDVLEIADSTMGAKELKPHMFAFKLRTDFLHLYLNTAQHS